MSELIVIGKSVGRNGINLGVDVAKIGTALTLIGTNRGGVFAPPLSIDGLAQAIESFQKFHSRAARDGRVDPGGSTLKRINEILNPGALPPTPRLGGTGTVRRIPPPNGIPNRVSSGTFTPVEQSFLSETVFQWTPVFGSGSIHYFELDQDVVPNWFGVVVPDGIAVGAAVHLFFHPTPSQAGFSDANYRTKVGWSPLFHYMTDLMSAQFCAARTGQILIMPLMTQGAAGDCGVLPQRWESIFGQILGLLAAGSSVQSASPAAISSVVVSSFSSGITYSAAFRSRASIGGRLKGIVDFDGIISSFRALSQSLPGSAIRLWQTAAPAGSIPALARQNIFPLPQPRWGGPFAKFFPPGGTLVVHGTIPQSMMHFAATRTRG